MMNIPTDEAVELFEGMMRSVAKLPCTCDEETGLCGSCLSVKVLTYGGAAEIVQKAKDISPDLPLDQIYARVGEILDEAGREGGLQ